MRSDSSNVVGITNEGYIVCSPVCSRIVFLKKLFESIYYYPAVAMHLRQKSVEDTISNIYVSAEL